MITDIEYISSYFSFSILVMDLRTLTQMFCWLRKMKPKNVALLENMSNFLIESKNVDESLIELKALMMKVLIRQTSQMNISLKCFELI